MIKTHCKIEMKGGYHKETTVFNIVIVRGINVYTNPYSIVNLISVQECIVEL